MGLAKLRKISDFSSNKRRLEYLSGRELPDMMLEGEGSGGRKSRISFELDPFYDIVSRFPELLDEDEDDSSPDDLFI